MAKRIDDEELVSLINGHTEDALGYGGEISEQREKSMEYYYGLPFNNEVAGRSSYVDSTVADTIEWIMPSLMRVFASGDEICVFNPVGPEDVEAAKQATDYVNHVLLKQNPGWTLIYDFFKTALLQKQGFLKVWWAEDESFEREEYENLSDLELEALLADDAVEVLEHTELEEDEGLVLHDIVIKRDNTKGQVKVEFVPPDEFLIARMSLTIQDSLFVCHRVEKTVSELRSMGYEIDPLELNVGESDFDQMSGERYSRYAYDNSSNLGIWGNDPNSSADPSTWKFWVHENFIRADANGDGIAEIMRIVCVGDKILEKEEVDYIPFVSCTPIRIPGKFFGLSVADTVMSLQLIKSALMRNLLDSAYNLNFGRYAVLEGQANLDDLLTQRPGGVVRVKSPNAIMPLPTPPLEPYSFQMLEYLDGVRESRAGVSRMSQGLNEGILTSHTTATAVTQAMTASQSRVELIARNFAETGMKDLCRMIYTLLLKHQDKETVVQLRNEWVSVNPSAWRDKTDCTVSTGLGFGNKDQQMAYLNQVLQLASQAMQGGLKIVNEQNIYNISKELLKTMGFMNTQEFLTDPSQMQPSGPSPEQQMAEAELQLKKQELEIKAADISVKQQKIEQVAAADAVDAQLKMQELQLEREQKRAVAIGAT
jgi:hypothetical protein